jgi:hypothetical protein
VVQWFTAPGGLFYNPTVPGYRGTLKSTLTVSELGAVIAATWMIGLQVHGEARSRFQLKATAAALNGVPSENVAPWRSLIVTVLPPLENV